MTFTSSNEPVVLHAHLLALEEQLLETATRADSHTLTNLLAEDFREFGSSGHVFDKGEIIAALAGETPRRITMRDFTCKSISADVALVTYWSQSETVVALRSSIWVEREGRWQILFHQGTTVLGRPVGRQ